MGSFKTLLRHSALGLLATAVLVTLAYFFVDRPVAYFVHDHEINQYDFLEWLTYPAMVFNTLGPTVAALAAIQLAWKPLTRWQTTLFAASISIMVAVAFEYDLKCLFGRYWPETWVNNNPSLIQDNAYGFHLFHIGSAYGSFPSGHTARAFAVMSVVWMAYPRWWWLGALVCAGVMVGLVGKNYHFVGDTIGGAFLGWVIGAYTCRLFRLDCREEVPVEVSQVCQVATM